MCDQTQGERLLTLLGRVWTHTNVCRRILTQTKTNVNAGYRQLTWAFSKYGHVLDPICKHETQENPSKRQNRVTVTRFCVLACINKMLPAAHFFFLRFQLRFVTLRDASPVRQPLYQ